jgi:hypothetical protein
MTIVQAISSTYKEIQHLRGLPHEFSQVNQTLLVAQDTLYLVHDQLRGQALDESSRNDLQPLVSGCEEKAKMLQDIFDNVEKGVKNTKDGSVLDFYRTFLLRLGKAHRVETLMQGVLRDLNVLGINQLFKTATQSQVVRLEEAVQQLSSVESSVPDSEFGGSITNTQNIGSGGTGHQVVNNGGEKSKFHYASGHMYVADTMKFGTES